LSKQHGSNSRLYAALGFLIIIVLGETVGLLTEYQNNSFLRDYVAQNTYAVTAEILLLILAGLGIGYAASRRPTGSEKVKGSGIFHRLGDIVTKRHRIVILAWVLILLASLPLALNVNQALTTQNSTGADNSESGRAAQLISNGFSNKQATSTALIVIVGNDVTDNATKHVVLDLEVGLTKPGALSSYQDFNSIYSVERSILVNTVTLLAPRCKALSFKPMLLRSSSMEYPQSSFRHGSPLTQGPTTIKHSQTMRRTMPRRPDSTL